MVTSRVVIALVVAALTWLALPGTFVFDDHSLFTHPAVTGPDAWSHWFRLELTRPLTYMSFWLDYSIWGANAAGFRFTNLLIHLLCAAVLFACAGMIFSRQVSALAALLFAIHPLSREPFLYVFARSSSLSALFCLGSLWLWMNRRPWVAAAVFSLAMLAKEEWVALPVFLALLSYASNERIPRGPIAAMLAAAALAGARVLYATKAVAGAGSGFGQSYSPWDYFILQGQALPGYFLRLFVPVSITIDPPVPAGGLVWGLAGWLSIVVIAAIALRRGLRVTSPWFWFLGAVLLILPSSSVLPAADPIAFRRMYMPMAIFSIGAAMLLALRPRVGDAVIAVLLVWSLLTGRVHQSERDLWIAAETADPARIRPKIQLSRMSPPEQALTYLNEAKRLAPKDPEVASELGRVLLASGDAAGALAEFGRALALAPGESRHVLNRGVALLLLHQDEAAKSEFSRALRLNPCLVQARENLRRMGVNAPPPSIPCDSIGSNVK
jgi:tetratricopeptide (TPR) repeat protein